MRLKRDSVLILFKVMDADTPSIIEAAFASPEAMDRYFVNHDLGRKHRLGEDGEIYPKFISKKFKFYSLEEVERKKVEKKTQSSLDKELEVAEPNEQLPPEESKEEEEETKEVKLDDLLEEDEERPPTDEGDK